MKQHTTILKENESPKAQKTKQKEITAESCIRKITTLSQHNLSNDDTMLGNEDNKQRKETKTKSRK